MIDDTQVPVKEDKCTSSTSLKVYRTAHFKLLMENTHVLEKTFVDSDNLGLERDILLQLGRLGAINLFNTCLSRTLKISNVLDLSDVPTEHVGEHKMKSEVDDHIGKVIVHSGKMKERKSRRERTLKNASEISFLSMPSKTIEKRFGKPTVSSVKRASRSRGRRLKVTRNEAEMSRGVRVVADLERIRRTLEEETGRVASLSCWAEAAGLDEKVLQQHLHYGWYCRDELIRSTRPLVLYLARNYRGQGIALEDLFQAGNLGILQGAERFDHTRGYRFSTYVQYWIRKSMSRMVAQHARGIQIPCTLSSTINKIQKARKALYRSHRKYPDDDEIAKHTGLSLAKIRSASKCFRVVGSIDQKMGEYMQYREVTPDMSIRSPEESVMRQHMRKDIHNLLKSLDSRERQVLFLRYGLEDYQPKSLADTGKLLQVTKEWIRKVEKKALTKLRDEDIRRDLSHFLDI
ncbi:RNA polymerase sigma factor sigC isoform X2 [Corylus avellana]|uniref:RNA polymerase sigma factor sigC isoform X2 n=1 Tax=Corylus avellana TaxID=13451 RepID=UPI00286A80B3|nr:RNA polymerase sigma factor sigC isoform X2 [Corylus avellana]